MKSANELLENWGRWSRGGGSKPNACSPLYRLMREHDPNFSPQDPSIEPNEEEAVFMDKIILAVCCGLERQILHGKYIAGDPDWLICKRNHIRDRDFPELFRKTLQKLDIAVRDPKIIAN